MYCTTIDNNEGKWTKKVPYVLTNLGRKPRAFSGSSRCCSGTLGCSFMTDRIRAVVMLVQPSVQQ
jgi:hypothetical protein